MTKINFIVMSRAEIENPIAYSKITEKHVVISINEDELAKIPFNENCMNVLPLQFHDIETDVEQYSPTLGIVKYQKFTEDMAKDILDFVDDMVLENFVGTIVVHCHAGVSRSVACAAALSKILNNEDDKIFKSGCPNMLVYRTLLDKYFLEENFNLVYPEIWKVRESNTKKVFNRLMNFKRRRK